MWLYTLVYGMDKGMQWKITKWQKSCWFSYDDNNNNEKKKLLIAKIHGKNYITDGVCTHQYADLSNDFWMKKKKQLHASSFVHFQFGERDPMKSSCWENTKDISDKDNEDDGGVYVYC